MLDKISAYLHGKAESYILNAIVDAQISQHIINYLKNGKKPSDSTAARTRASAFIKQESLERDHLIITAFCEKYINGYFNYFYAKIMYKIINEKPAIDKDYYKSFKGLYYSPIIYTYNTLFNYHKMARQYAKEQGLELKISDRQIKNAIINVQEKNIKINRKNARILLDGSPSENKKIIHLRQLSERSTYPDMFLHSAAKTQISAARWDRLYTKLLG